MYPKIRSYLFAKFVVALKFGKTHRGILFGWVLLFPLLFGSLRIGAQYGNQWIQYDQPYWQFKIVEDGWYRIDYPTLSDAGFPISTTDPRNIQIFSKEKEMMIRIEGESDGTFNSEDYIEFYAVGNDGWLDAEVYDDPQHQANPHYSLFNDTLCYYLTFNNNFDNQRIQTFGQTDFNSYQTLPFVRTTSIVEYHNEYLIGNQDQNGMSLPWYEEGEGWFDLKFPKGQTRHTDVPTPHSYVATDAPAAQVLAVSASASNASGTYNHHLQVGWGNAFNLVLDEVFAGYKLHQANFEIPGNQLGDVTRVSHKSIDDLGVISDWQAVGRVEINYTRDLNFEGINALFFEIDNVFSEDLALLEMHNVELTNPHLFIMMQGFVQEITFAFDGSTLTALVPFEINPNTIQLYLGNSEEVQLVNELQKVTNSGYFTDFGSLQLDSAFLMITTSSLMTAASNYAFYRESQGMEVLLTDVEELYLQYGGGVFKHPLSIRRFCDHLLQTWSNPPSHLFLVGKSIHEMDISSTQGARNSAELYAKNLVPTWGWPPSDLPFTVGLANTISEAAIPTGRLAAKNQDELLEYLNKVVEFEAQPAAEWMKNVMHFGGGSNAFEQGLFHNYLNTYTQIIQDTCFGGVVHSFFKTSTDPIQFNLSDSIDYLISNGVSLMTFFGHASSTGFDQNIDSPNNYGNQGKYPLLIGNSCYTGNIHLASSQSTSEEFVLAPHRGVIAFIAKSDLGIPVYLNMFTHNFYQEIFQKKYGQSIGQCMVQSVKDYQTDLADFYRVNTALTFALHGDPSLKLNAHPLPDLTVQPNRMFFEPKNVTAQLDSFDVKIVITNIGKAINNSFGVELIRHYPEGQDSSYSQEMDALFFRDTVTFRLASDRQNGVGMNHFDVFVDYPVSLVDELDDSGNNTIMGESLLISSGDLIPVYPPEFAVVPNNQVVLKASTGFPFTEEKSYLVQIDTSATFNSPWLLEHLCSQSGGVVVWDLPTLLQDSTVYFWRAAADSLDETGYHWKSSSFQYIPNQTGWGQAHVGQFAKNKFNRLNLNGSNSTTFETGELILQCVVYGNPSDNFEALATRYQIDVELMDYNGCGNDPAFIVAIIDPVTLQPWESNYNGAFPEHDFGNLMSCANARNRPEKYFIFRQSDAGEMAGFINLIQNEIPNGYYLLIYTWQFVDYDSWDVIAPELYPLFSDLGASQIGLSQDSVPFIFFKEMGYPEPNVEMYGNTIDDILEVETPMLGTSGVGSMTTSVIGPSESWVETDWQIETAGTDSSRIEIYGVKPNGTQTEVANFYQSPNEIPNFSDLVSADDYSRIMLRASFFDFEELSPAQLHAWYIKYAPLPECAINPYLHFVFENDTLAEGQELLFAVAVENLGVVPLDSLLVHYWIEDENQNKIWIDYPRQDSLQVGEVLVDSIWVATQGLAGTNTLWMEVNPLVSSGDYDQREAYHFNNLAQKSFVVVGDRINPILDVTFDGIHILDGETVSNLPLILISLDDENQFFVMNDMSDTSNFKLFLSTPKFNQKPLYFSNPEITVIPGNLPANKFKIEYTPLFEEDGVYQLLVQAGDKSGNLSGNVDYRINFEIFSKPTITEVMNYPNPFSTRTQFVFTLTGERPPDEFSIQIMTINGSVVREIDASELGPLHIGRNFTDYWWDGRDQFGDPLANGVYLYRVKARLNGEEVQLRESSASRYFKKGYGKMYLLR